MKILYVTTISLTMNSFFKSHVEMLVGQGHQVDIACNHRDLPLDPLFSRLGCGFYQVDFSRSPRSADNLRAYGQLKQVIRKGGYHIVHCHTPNASVITRLVCRKFRKKTGLQVFYTAHGFHFYKGASLKNWLIFYPVEKFCSRLTDRLITINREDYALAKEKFHCPQVHYVPGVGIDLSRFDRVPVDRRAKRRELGVPEDACLILSVGELNENKNHRCVLQAMAEMENQHVHYAVAGVGDRREQLLAQAEALGLSDRFHLLGYRTDVGELYRCADIFCFPSLREGLSVSVMEAMASGLPCVVSRIRGNVDLIDGNPRFLFDPRDPAQCRASLEAMDQTAREEAQAYNRQKAACYAIDNVLERMREIYNACTVEHKG